MAAHRPDSTPLPPRAAAERVSVHAAGHFAHGGGSGAPARLAYQSAKTIDRIVTNAPGVPVARYVTGAEIAAAYPFGRSLRAAR